LNITYNQTDTLNAVLTLEIQPDDYLGKLNASVQKIAKSAKMPGFRPGKVPKSLIKKMYGPGILQDELNKLLQAEVDAYIQNQKIKILGQPLPVPLDSLQLEWDEPIAYTFSFELGLMPEFTPDLNISGVNKYTLEVDDAFLEREVLKIRKRLGTRKPAEDVALAGDEVLANIVEKTPDGNIVEGGFDKNFNFNPLSFDYPEFEKVLIGKKTGDTFQLDFKKVYKSENKTANLLGILVENFQKIKPENILECTVKSIEHFEPAELNLEFFEKVFPEVKLENEEDFKAHLKTKLKESLDVAEAEYYQYRLKNALIQANSIELPETFLKRWLMDQKENTISEEELERSFTEGYAAPLRWKILENALLEFLEVKEISPEELKEAVAEKVRLSFGDVKDDQLELFENYFMQDEKSMQKIQDALIAKKLFTKVTEKINPEVKNITAGEFEHV